MSNGNISPLDRVPEQGAFSSKIGKHFDSLFRSGPGLWRRSAMWSISSNSGLMMYLVEKKVIPFSVGMFSRPHATETGKLFLTLSENSAMYQFIVSTQYTTQCCSLNASSSVAEGRYAPCHRQTMGRLKALRLRHTQEQKGFTGSHGRAYPTIRLAWLLLRSFCIRATYEDENSLADSIYLGLALAAFLNFDNFFGPQPYIRPTPIECPFVGEIRQS
ncbi:hypothetical protein BDP27DRAFT_815617 [Rhodocollybia butyracea]|uniref:Uncharacterized protein n=1 Tax=Rhodocollybia butyracea TaxID=206335 RepID=A0A9P5PSE1_9AGAR|nr:hypothetical protein BDP27DRAFT_815617 [Rhodocollybia butyracea]